MLTSTSRTLSRVRGMKIERRAYFAMTRSPQCGQCAEAVSPAFQGASIGPSSDVMTREQYEATCWDSLVPSTTEVHRWLGPCQAVTRFLHSGRVSRTSPCRVVP